MIRGVSNRKTRRHPTKARGAVQAGPAGAPLSGDDLVFGTAKQLRRMAEALERGDQRTSSRAAAAARGRVTSYKQRHPDADLAQLVGRPICETAVAEPQARGPRVSNKLRVENGTGGGPAELWIDDYLEAPNYWGDGISGRSVREALDEIGDQDVVVHMNSGGGDYFEGVAIYQALRAHPGSVYVAVVALAASAASVVAMAGDTVGIGEGAFLMIHEASSFAYGNSADLLTIANMLDAVDEQIAGFYARKAGAGTDWRAAMTAESWYGPEAAIAAKLADEMLTIPAMGGGGEDDDDEDEGMHEMDPAMAAVFPWLPRNTPRPAPVPDPDPDPPADWASLFSDDMEDLFT